MRKLLLATVVILAGVVGIASAAPAQKVFVCKYVGKPGVNETLQTGQNPISVSSNAIKDYKGVGSSFNDAQGRSLVIAEDNGQAAPKCPVQQDAGPTTPTPTLGTSTELDASFTGGK